MTLTIQRQPDAAARLDRAVEAAFARFAVRYADWANSLFDRHFLRRYAVGALTAFAAGHLDRQAAAEALAAAWRRQLGDDTDRRRDQTDLICVASEYLRWFVEELDRQARGNQARRWVKWLAATRPNLGKRS